MKRFLARYFNFIDDLRRAADNCEKGGFGNSAGCLSFYADILEKYRPDQLFLCDTARSSYYGLKAWQKNTLHIAEAYDCCVFNWQEIEDLAKRLDAFAHEQKGCSEEVRVTNRDGWDKYRIRPGINIGSGCSIAFTPINGDYVY